MAADHVEGGMYIGPEFLLGQVYDGALDTSEPLVIYRPVYPCIPHTLPSQDTPRTSQKRAIQPVSANEIKLRMSSIDAPSDGARPSGILKNKSLNDEDKSSSKSKRNQK